ncbi:PGF-CTERM sorting domain-containing protein [Natronolimnobius sp. AArcel1]|uniref:PGF-CTERM sorting domain-containing protein n=1 Tax=Natronolimnobius sp. AArcel1 TaxID=1679093 RepID=UPI0019D19C96|nr:PGF-CTERM sorting domain-containing protein [Natronolimnobius sp. AArcel1]
MTNETSYREKGRALFLAAMMVLSVVAMSAAFAGGAAAAVNEDNYDEGVTFNDGVIDEDVWVGQELTLISDDDDHHSGLVSIVEGPELDEGDTVETESVDGDTVTFETDDLEEDEYYHIRVHNGDNDDFNFEGQTFEAVSENLETEFTDDTVAEEGSVDLEVESDRDYQHLNVTADDLDEEQLEDLFNVDTHPAEHDDAILLEDVEDDDALEANFSNASIDTGEYEFTFEVSDSIDYDTATIEVTDASEDYYFADVDQVSEGEIGNITIGVEESSTASVVLGDYNETSHVTGIDLYDIDSDEVVLEYNTHGANNSDIGEEGYGWDVHEDYEDNASIDNVEIQSGLDENQPLPSHNWDLSIGEGLEQNGDNWEVSDERDRDVFSVGDREAIGDASLYTAPYDDGLDNSGVDFDDYNDSTITPTDTVADDDALILTVDDFGVEGAIDDDTEIGHLSGVNISIEEQDSGPIGDAAYWNTSDEYDGEDEELDAYLIGDEYDGDLTFVVDYAGADGLDADEDYYVTFEVTEDNEYIDDEDDEVESELELSLEDREVDWDTISGLPADEDATATGVTNIAPGSELDADIDSDEGNFVDITTADVIDGEYGEYTFEAEFDLSGEADQEGVLFDMTVEDPHSDADDDLSDVELLPAGEEGEPAAFDVDADAPSSVEVGDDATLDVVVENTGTESGETNYSVVIDGEQVDEDTIELDGEESTDTMSYDFDTDAEGDIEWEVATDHDDASDTLTVEDGTDDGDDGVDDGVDDGDDGVDDGDDGVDDEEPTDDDDDGTPGFGVAVALFALLAAAMLALRKQD